LGSQDELWLISLLESARELENQWKDPKKSSPQMRGCTNSSPGRWDGYAGSK
jgi:hypothetical protein